MLLTSDAQIRELNGKWRGQERPTNVLSFPADLPTVVESTLLGDLVICAPVVLREAQDLLKRASNFHEFKTKLKTH